MVHIDIMFAEYFLSLVSVIILNAGLSLSLTETIVDPVEGEDGPIEDDVVYDELGFYAAARSPIIPLSTRFYTRVTVLKDFKKAFTQDFVLQGIRFFIQMTKVSNNLSIFIWVRGEDMALDHGRKLHVTFKAVSAVNSISKSFSKDINWRKPQSIGVQNFMRFDDFINNKKGFVQSQKALFEFSVSVDAPFPINPGCK